MSRLALVWGSLGWGAWGLCLSWSPAIPTEMECLCLFQFCIPMGPAVHTSSLTGPSVLLAEPHFQSLRWVPCRCASVSGEQKRAPSFLCPWATGARLMCVHTAAPDTAREAV